MPVCICGFSTETPVCNGTHRIVKQVRESIAQEIEADLLLDSETKDRIVSLIRKNKRGY